MAPSAQTQSDLDHELPRLREMLARLENEKTANVRENFEKKLEKADGKQLWTASTNSDGYPKMKDGEKLRLASHIALELGGRKTPAAGQVVMHRDNNPKNLELSNLRLGTQKQNLKMMRDQGRDRPRGVDQEPDVKTASVSPKWVSFAHEVDRLLRAK